MTMSIFIVLDVFCLLMELIDLETGVASFKIGNKYLSYLTVLFSNYCPVLTFRKWELFPKKKMEIFAVISVIHCLQLLHYHQILWHINEIQDNKASKFSAV